MGWLRVVLAIAITIGIIFLIYKIFRSFWLSRILSLTTCGLLLYMAWTMDSAARAENEWKFILLATLAWQMFMGEKAVAVGSAGLLVKRCGTWYQDTLDDLIPTTVITLIVMGFLYHCIGFTCYLIPSLVIALDVISIFRYKK